MNTTITAPTVAEYLEVLVPQFSAKYRSMYEDIFRSQLVEATAGPSRLRPKDAELLHMEWIDNVPSDTFVMFTLAYNTFNQSIGRLRMYRDIESFGVLKWLENGSTLLNRVVRFQDFANWLHQVFPGDAEMEAIMASLPHVPYPHTPLYIEMDYNLDSVMLEIQLTQTGRPQPKHNYTFPIDYRVFPVTAHPKE